MDATATIVLAGNPNSGKTTLFNRLTGAGQRTANYPGITMGTTRGTFRTADGRSFTVVDLPGTYSLDAHSPEEEIAQRVLLGDGDSAHETDLVGVVVDATNLERNLYLASQLIELGLPTVIILNMVDAAARLGLTIDSAALEHELGVPVVPIVATDRRYLADLEKGFDRALQPGPTRWGARRIQLAPESEALLGELAEAIAGSLPAISAAQADFLARKVAGQTQTPLIQQLRHLPSVRVRLDAFHRQHADVDLEQAEIHERYGWIEEVLGRVLARPDLGPTLTDRVDRIVLHRAFGPLILFSVFTLLFTAIFVLAAYPMDWIEALKGRAAQTASGLIGAGELGSLVADGIIEGVGAVVVFLPQIVLLFLFVVFLEDFGYLARAAFILDRPMSKVGLSGRAFTPLLSSMACAIPGIMATRNIPSRRERFLTIMIAPLMVCSARLPVYSLLIAAFIVPAYGALAGGLVFVGLYLVSLVAAAAVALLFGRTVLRGKGEPLMLELPDYRRPNWPNILRTTWSRSWDFLRNAGTIILSIAIVLWFLASHPTTPAGAAADDSDTAATAQLEYSLAGRIGRAMEPAIEPLGYDWKLGIALLTSFAAREVFVGTMSTLYGLSEDGAQSESNLVDRIRRDRRADGTRRYSLATALSLLLFYAFACQCMSTVAVVARETRSWRWPIFMFGYMTVIAYVSALIVYQGARLLGFA